MSYDFNAQEIFKMAEQIERNGVIFYKKAAEDATDPEAKEFLTFMAEIEGEHENVFATMRAELDAGETKAWERKRNGQQKSVDWQFTTEDARIKLKRLYPKFNL